MSSSGQATLGLYKNALEQAVGIPTAPTYLRSPRIKTSTQQLAAHGLPPTALPTSCALYEDVLLYAVCATAYALAYPQDSVVVVWA
ncbi:unnamed protein product [Peniophora sp. CBMAI 1063]|nr:unnamed protein product [Peniophora sp. CBMAI 1063]